jgi:hypothetical protein
MFSIGLMRGADRHDPARVRAYDANRPAGLGGYRQLHNEASILGHSIHARIGQAEKIMRSIVAVFVSLFMAACGTTEFASAPVVPNAVEWTALQKDIYTTFTNLKLGGTPEISPLHANDALGTPANSAICLRNSGGGDTKYVVFLISRNKVADYRFALELDRCAAQTYSPLPKPKPP